MSDIHLDATGLHDDGRPGHDTNPALFQSAIVAMQRVEPAPPVVVINGDFLAHVFEARTAASTMRLFARKFNEAFPAAQFILVMGNEDSDCGDYGIAPNSALFGAIIRAWEPLINRHGAAPSFARTFARDGFYVARLPIAGLRAVVIDDVFWSPRYHTSCGVAGDVAASASNELAMALPLNARTGAWIFAHIPPGIDAYSTVHIAHGLAVVPFLAAEPKDRLVALAGEGPRAVRLVITGHTHKFGFRVIPGTPRVPELSIPSVSPVFRNAPAFLAVRVSKIGRISAIDEWSLRANRWSKLGDLSTLGMTGDLSAASIDAMLARLARDPTLRTRYAELYSAGGPREIDERNWPLYRCASIALSLTSFRACAGTGGLSIVTRRGIVVGVILAVLLLAVSVVAIILRRGRNRFAQSQSVRAKRG